MLFISRRYLCIYRSNEKLDVVEKRNLRELLEARPSNTIYFETADNKLYGMISYGDIRKARDGIVRINNSFVSLERDAYMEARERFRKSNSICEIPVVKNGQLVGEFHKFDDELMIDRAVDLDNNAYAPAYFARLRNVAIVKPPASRDYKMRYFEKLKRIFDHYAVAYTVLEVSDIAQNLTRFDRFFVVDEQERRGAHIIISLFEDKQHFFYKIVTFLRMLNRIESDEAIDYKKLFSELEKRGVETVLMTAKRNDSNYVVKTEKEMKQRFPTVANNLNKLMVQYEKQFFDDLYEESYARDIEACLFSIQRVRDGMRLKDFESEHVNIEHGERATINQPDHYERTIYFFGQCLIIGAYVDDAHTIESYLQNMANEAGYKVRVVNCGCWGTAIQSIARMLSTPLREGDIVVMLSEDPDVDTAGLKTVDLWRTLEENQAPSAWMLDLPYHANHHVSKLCAKALFNVIFDSGYRNNPGKTERITQSFDIVDQVVQESDGQVGVLAVGGDGEELAGLHVVGGLGIGAGPGGDAQLDAVGFSSLGESGQLVGEGEGAPGTHVVGGAEHEGMAVNVVGVHVGDAVVIVQPAFFDALHQAGIVTGGFFSGQRGAFGVPQGFMAQAAGVIGDVVFGVAVAIDDADAAGFIDLPGDFFKLFPGDVVRHFDAHGIGQGLVVQQGGGVHAGAQGVQAVAHLAAGQDVFGQAAHIQGAAFNVGSQIQQIAGFHPLLQVSIVLLHEVGQVVVGGIGAHQGPVVGPVLRVGVEGHVGIVFSKERHGVQGSSVAHLVAPPAKAQLHRAGGSGIEGANFQFRQSGNSSQGQHGGQNQSKQLFHKDPPFECDFLLVILYKVYFWLSSKMMQ